MVVGHRGLPRSLVADRGRWRTRSGPRTSGSGVASAGRARATRPRPATAGALQSGDRRRRARASGLTGTIVAISVSEQHAQREVIDVGSLAYSALCWTLADAIMGP
jgi:hypothetical protein